MNEVTESKFSPMEEQELITVFKAFNDDEKALLCETLPTEALEYELYRREQVYTNILNDIINVLNGPLDNLADKQKATLEIIRILKKGGRKSNHP